MGKIIMKAINTFLFVLCITIMLDFLAAADEIPDNVKTFPGHLKIKSNKNDGDGLCLSAEKFERGAKLFQQDCADANAWIIVNFRISRSKKRLFKKTKRWTDWRYSIETVPGRDFTFDPAGKKKNNGAKIHIWSADHQVHQAWNIERCNDVPGEVYVLRSYNANKCLDDRGDAGEDNEYHLWDCSCSNENQQFRIVRA